MSDHDPDDRHSPGLEALHINYALREETPPPFLGPTPAKHEAAAAVTKSPGGEGTLNCSRKRQHNSSLPESAEGNSVLIRSLEPNRPDIAHYEQLHPLKIEHLRADPPDWTPAVKKDPVSAANVPPPPHSPSSPKDLTSKANIALQLLLQKNQSPSPPGPDKPKEKPFKEPPPLLKEEPPAPHDDKLREFMIPNPEGPSKDLLPALHSPDNSHTLPPLQAALSGITTISGEPHGRLPGSSPYSLPSVTATSPPGLRTDPVWELQRPAQFGPSPQVPPSPYSHYSPASATDLSAVSSPVSHHSYRRPPLKADIPYINSPYETTTHSAKSPATSYPTPTDHHTPGCPGDRTPYSQPSQPTPIAPAGTYKCSHPGCNALPFQTQYLLNSHAKVHSQDRPHFCPVEGCPRGLGGKGFKRKNEMIRHGLVHNSPGYMCPFCPDQQHKYPRPDNLQRHVRVHHVDKDKDDPLLRQVLAQRPEGSTRGRRRRNNVA
ncbi:hypothetical protein BDV59DRAFT_986 [Aspergillus ambiguus]|uniref:uncharacterized protein n=1 Tax=Aspergillus ambiguus TaxID=176160 RepID=UPI003CCD076D